MINNIQEKNTKELGDDSKYRGPRKTLFKISKNIRNPSDNVRKSSVQLPPANLWQFSEIFG